jgi:hypothetical protein
MIATKGRENWHRVRSFKAGEVIHLFSNTDQSSDDGSQLQFQELKLSFTLGKGAAVAGLPMSKFKKFIEERPRLSALATILRLRMATLVANNVYFEGISPHKVRQLMTALSQINYYQYNAYSLLSKLFPYRFLDQRTRTSAGP